MSDVNELRKLASDAEAQQSVTINVTALRRAADEIERLRDRTTLLESTESSRLVSAQLERDEAREAARWFVANIRCQTQEQEAIWRQLWPWLIEEETQHE